MVGGSALVAHKLCALELQAGRPKKGNRRGPAYAYNVKTLRHQEMAIAEQAERAYRHIVGRWQSRPARKRRAADVAESRGAPRQPVDGSSPRRARAAVAAVPQRRDTDTETKPLSISSVQISEP
jgi:hypothetical protein